MSTTANITGTAATPYSVSAPVTNGSVNVSGSSTTGTAPASTATSSSSSSGTSALGESDFLQLLITQLENQDPTSPMDDTEFVSELAQFQSLESSNNTEQAVQTLNTTMTSAATSQQQSANAVAGAWRSRSSAKRSRCSFRPFPTAGAAAIPFPYASGRAAARRCRSKIQPATLSKR